MKRQYLIVQRFGRLTVLDDGIIKKGRRYYLCRCACDGKTLMVLGGSLACGETKSCGCLRIERLKGLTIHGAKSSNRTRKQKCIYTAWRNMHSRCFKPKGAHFKDYGGRGIQVYAQWCLDFRIFWRDMEATWFPGSLI